MKPFCALLFCCIARFSGAFTAAPTHLSSIAQSRRSTNDRSSNSETSLRASGGNSGEFEYQELLIQLRAMKQQKVTSNMLRDDKRKELEHFARVVCARKPSSPVAISQMPERLPNTKWRLTLSSQSLIEGLPPDATVVLEFVNSDTLNYCLEFGKKTFGLSRIAAKSSYSVQTDPPSPGLVQFTYDSVTTDLFGFSNLAVGFLGMLKGRTTAISTEYYDGKLWIERGFDQANGGLEFFNVYVLDDEIVGGSKQSSTSSSASSGGFASQFGTSWDD